MRKMNSPRTLGSQILIVILGGLVVTGASAMADAASGAALDQGSAGQIGTITFDEGVPFEIKDFSFGAENPTTIEGAAGRIKFNEFTIKKTSDAASPALFRNFVEGSHYRTVIIEMRKAGGDPSSAGKPFLRFRFETVFTTKIDWSSAGRDGLEESLSFVFEKVSLSAVGASGGDSSGR